MCSWLSTNILSKMFMEKFKEKCLTVKTLKGAKGAKLKMRTFSAEGQQHFFVTAGLC